MEDIQLRIKELISALDMTANEFARSLGYKRSDKIYFIINGKTKPSFEILNDITNTFVHVNSRWLLSGDGAMFNELGGVQDIPIEYGLGPPGNIALVETRAAAGYPVAVNDREYIRHLPSFSLP